MDITFDTIYKRYQEIFPGHTINFEKATWFDPWAIGLACLKGIEFKDQADKNLVLPKDADMLTYLKRMHFNKILMEFTYNSFLGPLRALEINEHDSDDVCEILHCEFRDALEAQLSSKIRRMFRHFGLNELDEARATALVGELGNNVFDHNDGQWPSSIRGAIILAQHNPNKHRIEIVVADPGIGFSGSLRAANKSIASDEDAIVLGMSGVTGRVGESRGNGLKVIQDWTINKFDGIVRIHSGSGLVVVDGNGQKAHSVFPIVGTLASFVVKYKQ